MHWTEVVLAVNESVIRRLPYVSRRACHVVYAHLPCIQYGECTEACRLPGYVIVAAVRDGLPQTSGKAGAGQAGVLGAAAWKPPAALRAGTSRDPVC